MGWISMKTTDGGEFHFWAESAPWLVHLMVLMHMHGVTPIWWKLDRE